MLELQLLRRDPDFVKKKLAVKNFQPLSLVDEVLSVDERRRKMQGEMDEVLNKSNIISKEIGGLYRNGQRDEAERKKSEASALSDQAHEMKKELQKVEKELFDLMVHLPNLPHDCVPPGKDEHDNEVVKEVGELPELNGEYVKPHWELAEMFNIISWELGVKITGAGFPVYIGKGARMQRAMIQYFLDEAVKAGYMEYQVPHLINEDSGFGTGSLPDKEGQMYHCRDDNFYLIPTAEVPLTNLYRGDMLKEDELPIKLVGYTPCFRREAGSYGKEVRGLNRVHQFDKVEIVQFTTPELSYKTLDAMVAHVEGLLKNLGLPYRILRLCGGDATFASALTYDFETYSAAQKLWLEVSSVSNFETFQTNRMKLRYKAKEDGKKHLVHTLNGSALALPRILATIIENYQTPEGIVVPEVLRPYTGFDIIN